VAEILGYADPSSAVSKKVDSEDKTTLPFQQSGSNYQLLSMSNKQPLTNSLHVQISKGSFYLSICSERF